MVPDLAERRKLQNLSFELNTLDISICRQSSERLRITSEGRGEVYRPRNRLIEVNRQPLRLRCAVPPTGR